MTQRPHPYALTPRYRVRCALSKRTPTLRRGQAWPLAATHPQASTGNQVPGAAILSRTAARHLTTAKATS